MNEERPPALPRKRRRVRTILAVAAAVLIVGALAVIATIALLDNATLRSQVTMADARAANAVSAAQAAAQKDYQARNAALNREAAGLNRQRQAIAAEISKLQANTIRAAGLYLVGHHIKSGTWHTAGDGSGRRWSLQLRVEQQRQQARLHRPLRQPHDGRPVRRLLFQYRRALHMGAPAIVTGPTG